jgi:glycosyltransferase involved in cell wall biosynthesis
MPLQKSNSVRPRLGFVVHVMQVAGAEMLVTRLIERLRNKVEPTIFCLDSLGILGQKMLDAGIPVVVLGRAPGIDSALPRRFAKELHRRGIEILHAHQYTPFFYSAMAKLYGAWGVKIIFTEHGRHYPDHVSWKRRLTNRWLLSRLCFARNACCDFSARATEINDGFHRVDTIANGVDLTALTPLGTAREREQLRGRLGLDIDRLYVVCVARFHPVKDHAMLLRGWRIVQDRVPGARLLLIGDGSERERMVALAEKLGIIDSVQFWGVRHDVADLLRAVDVFTLTSETEASSLTLLEAMACECPAVITDVGGNGEHVTDGVEGWLVPRGDHITLAERLIRALECPELRNKMASAARRRVERQFSLEDTVAKYEELYRLAARVQSR